VSFRRRRLYFDGPLTCIYPGTGIPVYRNAETFLKSLKLTFLFNISHARTAFCIKTASVVGRAVGASRERLRDVDLLLDLERGFLSRLRDLLRDLRLRDILRDLDRDTLSLLLRSPSDFFSCNILFIFLLL